MIRPIGDRVLVRLEPIPERSGSIVMLASDAMRVRTGIVLRVGPGSYPAKSSKRRPVDVKVGERIAFFREHLEHKQGKQVTRILSELEENTGLLREPDILFAIPEGAEVRVG